MCRAAFAKCAAIAGVLGLSSTSAYAALNIDLRATHLNGVPLSGGNTAKHVDAHVDDVIAFDVFAVIVGINANTSDDKFIQASGSFLSGFFINNLDVRGNLAMDLVRSEIDPDTGNIILPGFDGDGSSVGLQQDLDLDGDIDVGSNVDSSSLNFWAARYALAPSGSAPAGSTSPTSGGRRIGFGTFTVTDGSFISTTINFDGRIGNTAASWIEDGVTIQGSAPNGLVPITVSAVPEPVAALPLAALSWIGCVRRRR